MSKTSYTIFKILNKNITEFLRIAWSSSNKKGDHIKKIIRQTKYTTTMSVHEMNTYVTHELNALNKRTRTTKNLNMTV